MSTPLRSVGIALDIIDVLADASELGVTELARRVGVAKSTAHRTCETLVRRGLLDRTPTGATGSVCVSSSSAAWPPSARPSETAGLPLLVELRNSLGETVQIGVPAGADVVYVERVEGQRALRYSTNARRSPIHRSSAGKVLATFNPAMVDARLRAGLEPSTGYTIVVPKVPARRAGAGSSARLRTQRRRDRARPVVARRPGTRPGGRPVVAAISMVGPSTRVVGDHEAHHAVVCRPGRGSSASRSPAASTPCGAAVRNRYQGRRCRRGGGTSRTRRP